MWRVGRKLGRTIYRQVNTEVSDEDQFIGICDTPQQAKLVVAALNRFDEGWKQPSLRDRWVPRGGGNGKDGLTVSDIRTDGKVICRKDAGGFTVKDVMDMNIDYEFVKPRKSVTPGR